MIDRASTFKHTVAPQRYRGSQGDTISEKLLAVGAVAAGFGLRLAYLLDSHPFFDEYTTILAARMILLRGIPVLPSGLFYEHGLLFTYLAVPFVGLAGWLGGVVGDGGLFLLARLPSLLIGVVSLALLYRIGERWFSRRAGLVAAVLLALSPEGIVWGGRARMYALAQLLALALAALVYLGSIGHGNARLRWLALVVLLGALLTQFGAIILVPPLLVGALVIGWVSHPPGERPWFMRRSVLAEGVALACVLVVAVLVKRLGQPLGAAPLGAPGAEDLGREMLNTITYQAGLVLDGSSLVQLLAREFGVPHHIWLSLLAILGGLVGLGTWLSTRASHDIAMPGRDQGQQRLHALFLWLLVTLPVLEIATLLESWRHNPRYLVMILPWFYLLVAAGMEGLLRLGQVRCRAKAMQLALSVGPWVLVAALTLLQGWGLWLDLRVTFLTPEPAYEEAFRYVGSRWQDGDVLLTMNTSAAALLLGRVDYFAAQVDAEQFLLAPSPHGEHTGPSVDRWVGAPWLGTAADFNAVLNKHRRSWFLVDNIRLPVYYRGDWLSMLKTQMEQVWSVDDALVFLTRPDRRPLPTLPGVAVNALLGESIRLSGYDDSGEAVLRPGDTYRLTLFWSASAPPSTNYTVFVHLRDAGGTTAAQQDAQPLGGDYPTSQWRPDEMVIDPHPIVLPPDLPPGRYQVWVGMYHLDTLERLVVTNDTSGENAIRLASVTVE